MNGMDNLIFLFPFSWPFYLSNRTLNWIQKKAIVKMKEIPLSEYPLI
jgi:hypothetical protein